MADETTRETLVSLFSHRVGQDRATAALQVKRAGKFESITWNQLAADVYRVAAGLRQRGVQPGDRVVQVAENRYEWIVTDLAVHFARGVHVAVHASLTGPQIAYQIADSGARLVIVSGGTQAEKLAAVGSLPLGLGFFSHDACELQIRNASVQPVSQLTRDITAADAQAIEREALANTAPDDLATILYTSGTTGEPKGVMLTHGNLASNALASLEAFAVEPDDLLLCWLPLSHIFARTADLYLWLAAGHRLALAESRDTLIADCQAVKPTLINGVPYFFDKICRVVREQGKADEPGVVNKLLGGRVRLCCSGGAALPDHVAHFFAERGVTLVQGYGLTESSPVITVGSPRAHRIGTVGRPLPGVEVRIAADGEILTRGPHVMRGYWKQPAATAEVIQDGWLHTGDLGQLEDGFLRITGRKKEILVTAGGKNVAPVYLEGLLGEDPLIAQAMIVGDARNYLAALIVPDHNALRAETARRQIAVASAAEALVHPEVLRLYAERISQRLENLAPCEQVGKFTLLPRGFSVESGELTPTLKLRRAVILQNFWNEVQALYEA